MKQRLTFLTLGVNDLEKMKTFYSEIFGWKTIKDSDGIVFYRLNGIILALYPAGELAEDIGVSSKGSGFKKFSLAINFSSQKEVDSTFIILEKKGVQVIKTPEKVFWGGYRGYVSDPEGNYWELAFNPYLEMDDSGNVKGHG
jgi:predicted enzyme related to lactoylglutathione lyase